MKLDSSLWFVKNDAYFGKGRIELLELIDKTGSISKAAKQMRMSYKAAWEAINEMNRESDEPIVIKLTGGKGGGGTVLTNKGKEYIKLYKELQNLQKLFFKTIQKYAVDINKLEKFISKPILRTSARNQFVGIIKEFHDFGTNVKLIASLSNNVEIVSKITKKSFLDLDIHLNDKVYLLFKSSFVKLQKNILQKEKGFNYLKGRIVSIQKEEDSSEVTIEISDKLKIVSSNKENKQFSLSDEVWCCFDSKSVLIAV